jgi:pilus assembly protein Flp/PilA
VTRRLSNKSDATTIEFRLIAAVIAIVIVTGVTAVGTHLSAALTKVPGKLSTGLVPE